MVKGKHDYFVMASSENSSMFSMTGMMLSDLINYEFNFMADNYVPFDDGNVNYHLFCILSVP